MTPDLLLVSVLLPVYQSEKYLEAAIESIRRQTFTGWELLLLDDGSSDGSPDICRKFAAHDDRIKYICLEHRGLTPTLNDGIALARGKYLARMDADDISDPLRFRKQVTFLESHPEVGLVGTAARFIDAAGKVVYRRQVDITDLEIRWRCLLMNPFIHPSVMMPRDVLIANQLSYDPKVKLAEDYDLWVRMLQVTKAANLGDELLDYRIHQESVSSINHIVQIDSHKDISENAFRIFLPGHPLGQGDLQEMYSFFRLPIHVVRTTLDAEKIVRNIFELWWLFEQEYKRDPGFKSLKKKVAQQIARRISSILGLPGLKKFNNNLGMIDEFWHMRFLLRLPAAAFHHYGMKRINRLRRDL